MQQTPTATTEGASRVQSVLQMATAITPLPIPAFLPISQRARKRKRDRLSGDDAKAARVCKVTRC